MGSRENILNTIETNQPEASDLPKIDFASQVKYDDPIAQFKTVLESIGGKLIFVNDLTEIKERLAEERESGSFIINNIQELGEVNTIVINFHAPELEKLERSYLRGSIAVAENGAIWVYESQMLNRLIPFICQHLVLVINKNEVVPTMHHAYQKIDIDKEGFGCFIAGPSKTADIEQSLVIGAHGARSLDVYLVG
jgi:L-lactate dehydrogenase complex protein LldG